MTVKIAVTSPSFSRSPVLREEVERYFPNARFNKWGRHPERDELLELLADCDGAIVGLDRIDDTLLEHLPKLKIIAKYGVGLDNIPQDVCQRRNIAVGWTGGVNRQAVAEQALALMIGLSRNLFTTSAQLKAGTWNKRGGRQLSELTIGIIGFGYIGQCLSGLLRPFGCRILVNDLVDHGEAFYLQRGVTPVDKETLFRTADIVSLHVDLNADSYHMVDSKVLSWMKSDSYLINTSRGVVVCQQALKTALMNGVIAGAALDVYEEEPPADREFLALPNLVCTPHISGNSKAAVEAMGRSAISHLVKFFQPSVVGTEVGVEPCELPSWAGQVS